MDSCLVRERADYGPGLSFRAPRSDVPNWLFEYSVAQAGRDFAHSLIQLQFFPTTQRTTRSADYAWVRRVLQRSLPARDGNREVVDFEPCVRPSGARRQAVASPVGLRQSALRAR